MMRRLLFTVAPFAWMGLIFYLSSQSGVGLPGPPEYWLDFVVKKFAHIAMYATLYLLWIKFFLVNNIKTHWLTPILFCFAYAGSDEFHQIFTPARSPALRDVGFDMLGVMIASLWHHKYL